GAASADNPACGDVVEVFVRVDGGRLAEASFLAQGCPAVIAGASFVLDRAVGSTVEEVGGLEVDGLLAEAGETSAARRHGFAMVVRALKEAAGG
ncbi:MAG: iron-sulfur cluster assembly scaffold protein, partial [Planctomycetota bacterium JB042]